MYLSQTSLFLFILSIPESKCTAFILIFIKFIDSINVKLFDF